MPLYFAYGANLDRAAMAIRCPGSKVSGTACLHDHRFTIVASGYASVVPAKGAVVHGLLWDLALQDVAALDRFEELGTGLYRKTTMPVVGSQGPRQAMIYIATDDREGVPRQGYLEAVLAAAGDCGLPIKYIRTVQHWLPRGRAAEGVRTPSRQT